ncbi:MAG: U32 family peptidase [Eubacterium sp.]|jgi:putative protease|nr:U32 family peptidase [Eubacterium sp.]
MKIKLRARVSEKFQLFAALDISDYEYIIAPIKLLSKDIPGKARIIADPPVFLGGMEKNAFERLKELKKQGFGRIYAHTPAHVALANKAEMISHGSFRLNITNSLSLLEYEKMGVSDIVCPIELNIKKARKLKRHVPLGVFAYGRVPLMVTRRCPVSGEAVCEKGNSGCTLVDRKGNSLLLTCDGICAEILNPDILWLGDKIDSFDGFDFMILSFTDESEIKKITESYKKNASVDGKFTRGLYFRSVE